MESIRTLREQKGMKQAKLAVLADMDPATLWRYETGKRSPTVDQLEKLAEVLEVEVIDFFANPKAQAPLPLDWDIDPARGIRSEGLYKVIEPDKFIKLWSLMIAEWERELDSRIEAADYDWLDRVTTIYAVGTEMLCEVDVNQLRDPETAYTQMESAVKSLEKFAERLQEVLDPDYQYRFAKILEASGEQMREMVASG